MSVEKSANFSRHDSRNDCGYDSGAIIHEPSSKQENSIQISTVTPEKKLGKVKQCRKCLFKSENLLVVFTVVGVIVGTLIGLHVRNTDLSDGAIQLVKFPGEIMLRGFKMMVVPFIITSIVSGLANLNLKKGGRIGIHAMVYYLSTTTLAVLLGIALVSAIHPGHPDRRDKTREKTAIQVSTLDTYLDLVRNFIPENIIAACFELDFTQITKAEANKSESSNVTDENAEEDITRNRIRLHNPNILGLMAFFLGFGIALSSLGEEGKPLTRIFSILNAIFMKMTMVFIWYSPIGICFLTATNIIENDSLEDIIHSIGLYMVTVIVGLMIHGLLILPLIYFLFTRQNPFKLMRGIYRALVTAMSIASSAATLPITMRCMEENLGVDERITKFMLPIGATVNMDGTALLEGIASVTVAQMYGMPLDFGQIVTISVTGTIASIGAACIPSAGLVTLLLVLTSIGIPTDAVALLWSMDWFLDRLRTGVNVFGDCVGVAIVYQKNKHLLDELSFNEKKEVEDNRSGDSDWKEESKALVHNF